MVYLYYSRSIRPGPYLRCLSAISTSWWYRPVHPGIGWLEHCQQQAIRASVSSQYMVLKLKIVSVQMLGLKNTYVRRKYRHGLHRVSRPKTRRRSPALPCHGPGSWGKDQQILAYDTHMNIWGFLLIIVDTQSHQNVSSHPELLSTIVRPKVPDTFAFLALGIILFSRSAPTDNAYFLQ